MLKNSIQEIRRANKSALVSTGVYASQQMGGHKMFAVLVFGLMYDNTTVLKAKSKSSLQKKQPKALARMHVKQKAPRNTDAPKIHIRDSQA